jgi:hypothetical protein
VALVRTDVSEELSGSIIRVTRISELGTSVLTRATRRNIPEDTILNSYHRENLKSYTVPVSVLFVTAVNILVTKEVSVTVLLREHHCGNFLFEIRHSINGKDVEEFCCFVVCLDKYHF